jgi:DNA repair protein RadC
MLADEVVEDASAMLAGQEAEQPDPSRQAMRRALDLHATALILVRVLERGPLEKPAMAREAALAARMARAAAPLAIVVHDHLLVGGENWVSLKQKGLL